MNFNLDLRYLHKIQCKIDPIDLSSDTNIGIQRIKSTNKIDRSQII